ncbi:triacylglycerol lipase [Pseudomonas sp. BN414]|uniref:esterase/lipase family protein n=1 Tax=Pseudomonas sp. BN414 TaxID=2567888 RepID=UPI00245485D1|nr:triacylglycerol lipase [Pseudomonas sp. BN414]MDH4566686.1 triacylglycerol lipase [Pseudomonas sp. BN414]
MNKHVGKLLAAATLTAVTITAALPLSAQAACFSLTGQCGYTKTQYPIVLVHGALGFDKIGLLDYWYGIPDQLRAYDGADVYLTQVSASNSHEVRGEQLLLQVQQILAVTGKSKVNLIGHSQGSPTARYVASVRPDLVASVTSVHGANGKGEAVDAILGITPPGMAGDAVQSISNGLTQLIGILSNDGGLPQNSAASLQSLSTAGSLAFNAAHPEGIPTTECGEGAYQVNGVKYFSWGGAQAYTNTADAIDPTLALVSLVFRGAKNDGLVSSCAQHLGKVIRDDYGMNHMDAINHTAGLVNLFETNPITLYRQHANRLKNAGL